MKELINSLFSPLTFVSLSIVVFFLAFSPFMFFGWVSAIGAALFGMVGLKQTGAALFGGPFWTETPEKIYNGLWSKRGGLAVTFISLAISGVRSCTPTPIQARCTLPLRTSCSAIRFAMFDGTANPMPCPRPTIIVFTPMT